MQSSIVRSERWPSPDQSRSDAPEAAILTRGLTKRYRSNWTLKVSRGIEDLNLEVRRGEVMGFLGPNGAGKTTTLKLLVGLHKPTSGQAWVLGAPIESPAARTRLGFLPEQPYFYDYLSGIEYLEFAGRLSGLSGQDASARAKHWLGRVGLGERPTLRLRKYSKGMLQRLGLAAALLHEPELLILDEPMSGLDPFGRHDVRDLILEQRQAGTTVLFSSHILPDVEILCDRVAIVMRGALQRIATVGELVQDGEQKIEIRCTGQPDLRVPPALAGCLERRERPHETVFVLTRDQRLKEVLAWLHRARCGGSRGDAAARLARGPVPGHRGARPGDVRAGTEIRMIAAVIARNTYREATRDRVLLGMASAGVVFLVAIQGLTPLALGEGTRLVVDLGLSAISMLGLLVVLLVGTSLVAKEIERRTIYTLLSRPIARPVYLIGKWAGLTASVWSIAAVLGVALWLVLCARGHSGFGPAIAQATYLAMLELAVVTSIAVMFSALSTPALSALYTLGAYCAGQWCYDLRRSRAVPDAAQGHGGHGRERGAEPAALQHAWPGVRGLDDHPAPPGARDRVRRALLRLRAGPRRGGLRVPGLQVIAFAATRGIRGRMAIAWALALALGAAALLAAGVAWRTLPHPRPLEELSYYPSGEYLRPIALGHAETAADLAWLRAVQYYGEHRADRPAVHADVPRVRRPHVAGAAVRPRVRLRRVRARPGGNDFPKAESLMQKGIEHNPDSGRLAFELGFLYYVRPGGRDLKRAAEYFEQAARMPDGPPAIAPASPPSPGRTRGTFGWPTSCGRASREPRQSVHARDGRTGDGAIREALDRGRAEIAVEAPDAPRR